MLSVFRSRAEVLVSSKIFLRRLFRTCTIMDMECDDDVLYYSHQKLKNLVSKKGEQFKDEVVIEYLKGLTYPPIKDFTAGLEWFNVSEPLSFKKHLKGKIVVLDFFTYCCINCMHILPDLRDIEHEFSVEEGVVVIGVHSAKFENEKVSANILAAVQRYGIGHPVVNDRGCDMWRSCEVSCWPTLLVLGPHANPVVMLMGEGHKENLRLYIANALKYYGAKGEISHHKLPYQSAFHLLPDLRGPLLFPGKVACIAGDDGKDLIAISDTGNHRILITDPSGTIRHEVGGSRAGFLDGPLSEAQFNSPQGLAFDSPAALYVADTENHAVRLVDLRAGAVRTVAGCGVQGGGAGGRLWTEQALSSPWDVCVYRTPDMDMTFYPNGDPPMRRVLLIAMAGKHQIWALFLDDTIWWKGKKYPAGSCIAIAGSGREENKNNQYPQNAAFAQPSGLALCAKNKEVYIADSESSSVRRLSLVDGKVSAVVGGDRNPNNLFAFGDKDGTLTEAKLQHLLGVAVSADEKTLYVADTYNHKLKKVDVTKNTIITLSGSDTTDGKQNTFNEPAGLCLSSNGKKLYLADTNNHRIKVLSLNAQNNITNVTDLDLKRTQTHRKVDHGKSPIYDTKAVSLSNKGGKLICKLDLKFADGLGLTQGIVQRWQVELPDATWSCVPISGNDLDNIDVVVSVPAKGTLENNTVAFVFNIVTCTDETCMPKDFVVQLPVSYGASDPTSVTRNVTVLVKPSDIKVE